MAKHKRSKQLEAGGSHDLSTSIAGPPDNNRIIVQHLDDGEQKIGGIIIPDAAKEKPQQGKVIAKRPGKRRQSDVMAWDQIRGFDQSSAEVGVQSASPSVDERRADMKHDRPYDHRWRNYRGDLLTPRMDPESWKTEPTESSPAVPKGSKLAGVSISTLESQYEVNIQVLEGDPKTLTPYSELLVQGTGLSVRRFFNDLTSFE